MSKKKNYFMEREVYSASAFELLESSWVTYDNKHFSINIKNTIYEIIFNQQSLEPNDIHNIAKKIIKRIDCFDEYISIYTYKANKLKSEAYFYKEIGSLDNYLFHNKKGYPSKIEYNLEGDITEVFWHYKGYDITNRVKYLIELFNIETVEDLFKPELKNIIEINFSI